MDGQLVIPHGLNCVTLDALACILNKRLTGSPLPVRRVTRARLSKVGTLEGLLCPCWIPMTFELPIGPEMTALKMDAR